MLILNSGCSKDEGYGGNSHIKGTLLEKVYNDDYSEVIYEQAAIDEDIFIMFENNGIVSDKVATGYNGQFEFEYLFPGTYQIFYYSDDTASAYNENKEIIIEVELGKNENADVGELTKINTTDYDEGSASISGTVYLINYLNSSTWPNLVVKDISLAQEEDIYITYGNHSFYDERIKTQHDGTYKFSNLIKGSYKIFLYTEDVTGGTEDIVIIEEVNITDEFENVKIDDIYIEQL